MNHPNTKHDQQAIEALLDSVTTPPRWRVTFMTVDVTNDAFPCSAPEVAIINNDPDDICRDCRNAWEVEDRFQAWWNRLQWLIVGSPPEFYGAAKYYLHRPTHRVVVLRVEPLGPDESGEQ